MSDQILLRTDEGGIATLVLNRPDKLNALDYPLIDALASALDDIETDDAIGSVILTGAGPKAFCAGADIKCFSSSVHAGVEIALRDFVRRGQRLTSRLETFPKPIIAAVNGLAFGGGCEMTEAVPLAIAAESASFAKPEIRLGFPPPFGGTQRLPRLVGRKRALKMLLTGEPITAREAAGIGLVNDVVPDEELLPAARELAGKVMAHSRLAVAACLAAVTRGINLPIDEGLAVEATQFGRMVPTRDIREGIGAFLERRPPSFGGH